MLAPPTAGVKISSIRLLVIAGSPGLVQQRQRPFTLFKTNEGKKVVYSFEDQQRQKLLAPFLIWILPVHKHTVNNDYITEGFINISIRKSV